MSPTVYAPLLRAVAALGLAATAGCSDQVGPPLTGSMGGTVSLFDEWGRPLTDLRGVTVEIVGTGLTATTDSAGRWLAEDVPQGVRDLVFHKPDFSEVRVIAQEFQGGTATTWVRPVLLVGKPTHEVEIDTILTSYLRFPDGRSDSAFIVVARPTAPPPAGGRVGAAVFAGRSSAVSNSAYEYGSWGPNSPADGLIRVVVPFFEARRFAAADGSFVVAIYAASGRLSGYLDPATDTQVITTVGAQRSVLTLQIP